MTLEKISVSFSTRKRFEKARIEALSDVSLGIAPKDMIVLVGESGSGKTTLGRVIAGLQKPTIGRVYFKGREISKLKGDSWSEYRRSVQLLHQDPYTTLNPSLTVERSLVPAILWWKMAKGGLDARAKAGECLRLVGLSPEEFLFKYPHQMSGGQKQRVAIARCISIEPKLMVLDEPVSMIDVSLRIGILDTLLEIRKRLATAFVFITHDFAVANYFCQKAGGGRIIVLYLGKVMEIGSHVEVIESSSNPYTMALLAATPGEKKEIDNEQAISRLSTLDEHSSSGCRFHPRCSYAEEICGKEEPKPIEVSPDHYSACHFALRVRAQSESGKVQISGQNAVST
jgi:peptide/nickel transport system ATP-binding protein